MHASNARVKLLTMIYELFAYSDVFVYYLYVYLHVYMHCQKNVSVYASV